LNNELYITKGKKRLGRIQSLFHVRITAYLNCNKKIIKIIKKLLTKPELLYEKLIYGKLFSLNREELQ